MDLLNTVMVIINAISLLLLGVGYLKSKFILVDLETYNAMLEIAEEYTEMKENENCGGGVGFHLYLNEEEEPEEEDE